MQHPTRYYYSISNHKHRKQIYNIYCQENGKTWIFDPILRWSIVDEVFDDPHQSTDAELSPYFDNLSDLLDYAMKLHADHKYDYDVPFLEFL